MHLVNYEHLWEGLIGAFLISIGIVFAEKYVDNKTADSGKKGFGYAVIGMLIFIVGWILFLITQPSYVYGLGIAIIIVAMAVQIYFAHVLNLSMEKRRKLIWITIIGWMTFIGLWFGYAYQLSLNTEKEFDGDRGALIYVGLFCLMGGMLGYFMNRKHDMYQFTGGIFPQLKTKSNEIFSPYFVILTFGWCLIAVGNSITSLPSKEIKISKDTDESDESEDESDNDDDA